MASADALLLDENALSRRAERGQEMPEPLLAAAAADLRALQALAAAGPHLPAAVAEAARLAAPPPWWDAPAEADSETLAARLAAAPDWGALLPELVAHYRASGSGLFARYRAFRWVGPSGDPPAARDPGAAAAHSWLVPVLVPDAVRPGDLIGYEPERALLRRNTVQFLAGYPANNVLLYGDRGTGKSSSIKALLNEGMPPHPPAPSPLVGEGESWPADGVDWSRLRLIEVPKGRLADFPLIVALLRGRAQRFIVFVDDLSFEDTETQYKELKALLEGGLEARPDNVVVYATSNRRHLVRERFADRTSPDSDEVHARDTVQEKLSFADRFGIAITFPTPDQATYLGIVEGLARRRGLRLEPAALRARAIEWAAWHNGRSGRTARQFVDHLAGELGLAAVTSGEVRDLPP